MFNAKNYTIVDLETTGGSPFFNRIIEVGLLRIERGQVVDSYQTLINPLMELPEFITNITGLTDRDLANAPLFSDVSTELKKKFDNAIFVAHNVDFDYGFLKEEYRRLGEVFAPQRMCTVRLSRHLYKDYKHHNLSAIIERFGFDIANRHRAFDDASILWDFLQVCQTDFDESVFAQALDKATINTRPKQINERIQPSY